MIIYGTYFGGKIEKVDEQWIESKYILLMVPLIPISSMFVTSKETNGRQGFAVSVNGKSVLHGYIRFFSFILGLVFLGISLFAQREVARMGFSPALIGGAFAMLYVWSYFQQRESKGLVYTERKRLGMTMGMNALPEWLPKAVRAELTQNLTNDVVAQIGTSDASEIARNMDLSSDQIGLAYSYLRYKTAKKRAATQDELDALTVITARFDEIIIQNANTIFEKLNQDIKEDLADDIEKVE